MFERLKELLGEPQRESPPAEVERRIHVATCVLLLEAAHADDDCTPREMEELLAVLTSRYEIEEGDLDELIALAHTEREKAVDLWQFTNHLNRHLSSDARLAIMTDVWRVIHADGLLERHEDHFAHKVAHLLRLSHRQLIEAKLKARGAAGGTGEKS